jgi:hypothetical protein
MTKIKIIGLILIVIIIGTLIYNYSIPPKPEMVSQKTIFKPTESVNFTLKINRNSLPTLSSVITPVFAAGESNLTNVWSEDDLTIKAYLTDTEDKSTDDTVTVSKINSSEYNISVNKDALTPGKHILQAEVTRNGITQNVEQNFLWGVLAMNFEQDKYIPGSVAAMDFAVLDEKGKMVCDADLNLKIFDGNSNVIEELSTGNGRIKVKETCKIKAYAETPDYEAQFNVPVLKGEYKAVLTAASKNGNYTIEDVLYVDDNPKFIIKRDTQTRIFPLAQYPVNIEITANSDFIGTVTERVPRSFEVTTSENVTVSTSDDSKSITWNVDWKKGQKYTLTYTYQSPLTSPEFYLLGPVSIVSENINYNETRQWQIAADAVVFQASHEAGNFSEYTTTSTDGGNLAITQAAALAGTNYGMSVTINGTLKYGVKTLPVASTTGVVRARLYADPNGLSMTNGAFSGILFLINSTGTQTVGSLQLIKNGTAYAFRVTIVDDSEVHHDASLVEVTDAPHYVEVRFTRATNSTSSDGTGEIWIDGIAYTGGAKLTGIDNYDKFATLKYISLGSNSVNGTNSGTYYLDELVVNDDGSEIGPVNGYVQPVIKGDFNIRGGVRIK